MICTDHRPEFPFRAHPRVAFESAVVMSAGTRIRALAQGVLESEENVNNLVDLLEYLESEKPAVLKCACSALSTAYVHLIRLNYTWLVHTGKPHSSRYSLPTSKTQNAVVSKFHDWMRKNYAACKDGLLKLLHHESNDVQDAALSSLLSLIQAEGTSHILSFPTYTFPNSLLHQVTGRLLDSQTDTSHLIGRFQDYLVYDDIRFYWMKNIASVLSLKLEQKKKQLQLTQQLVENAFSVLRLLHQLIPGSDSDLTEFFAGEPPVISADSQDHKKQEKEEEREEEEEEREGDGERGERSGEGGSGDEALEPPKAKKSRSQVRALNVQTLQKHRKHFSDAWLTFLRLPLTSSVHKKILVSLHSEVMPHLVEPRLLLDFLVDSYDTGGVISLLALNGLFILMHQYHLDYPDFYSKLFGLLEPSVFHVKYMPRFFSLMDTFLSSTHLPLYLVAAFAKKIARLALSAPPQGVTVALIFIVNLLKRHPNCKVLLHRKNDEDVYLTSDPFMMAEKDPSQCRALESCLWEMKTLQAHYCPEVSSLASQLLVSVNRKVEENIGKYLDRDDEELMKNAATKLANGQTVPLNFQKPTILWNFAE